MTGLHLNGRLTEVARMKTPPGIGLPAFVCPHCRAFTQQTWFKVAAHHTQTAQAFDRDRVTELLDIESAKDEDAQDAVALELYKTIDRAIQYDLAALLRAPSGKWPSADHNVWNMHLSRCFACKKEAVWLGAKIIHPLTPVEVEEVNQDVPPEIARDYDEAAALLVHSPRAAAALLRLAIQKLCSHILARPGDINEMIGELVKNGLNPRVQKALDIVRVVGNEALHPGTMDIRDDQETARQLFRLVNLIAEAMITTPKHIDDLFTALPPAKRKGIEDRDRPKNAKP